MKPNTLIFAVWLGVAAPLQAASAQAVPPRIGEPVASPYAAAPTSPMAPVYGGQVAQRYTLPQLVDLALNSNKGVEAASAGVEAARAGLTTARAYPNPEVEYLAGRASARQAGGAAGSTQTVSVSQRIDLPNQRSLRSAIANYSLDVSRAGRSLFLTDLVAAVKQGYYEVLRREAEFQAAEEDLALAQQLFDRAQVRVDAGDAPRGEQLRAETELLSARNNSQSALLRVTRAKSFLRQQVGGGLPMTFALEGGLRGEPTVPTLESLRQTLMTTNPELLQLRTEFDRARVAVDYERSLAVPTVALRAAHEREPDVQNTRVGVSISVPLWDRRRGPIDEAAARLIQARSLLEAREFALAQELDSAYQQFQIASAQVSALESGIVRQAEASLRVAEAAYRFGERGILEYFDAQRTLRAARSSLIAAQFDLQLAAVDIERLLALNSVGQP